MLVSKKLGGPNATPHLPNTTPNVSRWNIGCVGSPCVGGCLGHVQGVTLSWAMLQSGCAVNVFFCVGVNGSEGRGGG